MGINSRSPFEFVFDKHSRHSEAFQTKQSYDHRSEFPRAVYPSLPFNWIPFPSQPHQVGIMEANRTEAAFFPTNEVCPSFSRCDAFAKK